MSEPLVRPATLEDAQPICDLINAVDLVDTGGAHCAVSEVVEDLTPPNMVLERDTWLAFEDSRLVAFGIMWNEYGNERLNIDHYVLPEALPTGEHILDLMVARCASAAAENGVGEAVVQLGLTPNSLLAQGPLTRRGWRAVRRFNQMTRPVSVESDPVPVPPPGVTVRNVDGEDDMRTLHRLNEESFAEHYGHQPTTYDDWRQRVRNSAQFEPRLSWIASLDGVDVGELVGRNNRPAEGWVRSLGVVSSARGRGIGTYLLRTAFAEFARLGRDKVGLGVDTDNSTGALALYEGLGMTVKFASDAWETRIPAEAAADAQLTDAAAN